MIYVRGHAPAHIHVLGHGGAAEVLIGLLALLAVRGPRGNAQVRKVMQIAAGRQAELRQARRKHHGQTE